MKDMKIVLAIAIATLLLTSGAFAGTKVALMPLGASVSISGTGHPTSMQLEAFCNGSPCNITWQQVVSNSNVGTLDRCSTCVDTSTGPISHFTAGTLPGWVVIVIDDGQGHVATTTVTVVP